MRRFPVRGRGLDPVVRASLEHDEVVVAGLFEQARGAHRAFSVSAHHHGGLSGQLGGPLGDVAEFDMNRSG
jgi:hypothetical protein